MSWSFSIQSTPKAEFPAAVDAAVAVGQLADTPGLAEDVAAGKAALKLLGSRVKRANVVGSAGGHCMIPSELATHSDSLSVNVYGENPE
jgi:hypothetical protein